MEKKNKKEKGTSFGDNLGWLILYLVLYGICTIPLVIGSVLPLDQDELKPVIIFFQNNGLLISFILVLILFMFVITKKKDLLSNEIKNFKKDKKKSIIYTIFGFALMFGGNLLLSDVIRPHLFSSSMSENQSTLVSIISDNTPIYSLIAYLLMLSVLVPILEEIFCRFNFRKSFKSTIMFIAITSLIFGALHIPNWSLSGELFYDLFVYSFMGVCLAYIYYKTDSICSSMIMHMLNNAISVIMMILPFIK